MRINHNLMAMNANRYLSATGSKQSKSLEKISSGLRINTAADDAAGLAISEKMRAQISGLEQASDNALDGISLIQTAEGALQETHSILQRMRELAVQSSNDTNTQSERDEIQKEVDELAKELTRIANNTEFNSKKISNGGLTAGNVGEVKFHIGANAGQDISLSLSAMDAKTLGVSRDVTTYTGDASGAANVASVSFDTTVGAEIRAGEDITVQYQAGAAEVAAVSETWDTGAMTALADTETGTIVFNGVTMTINAASGAAAGAAYAAGTITLDIDSDVDTTAAAQMQRIADAFSGYTGGTELDDFTFVNNAGALEITDSTTNGDNNTALTVDQTGNVSLANAAAGSVTSSATGVDYVAATNDQIVITNTTTAVTQNVDVTSTDATVSVSGGNFDGLTINAATDLASIGAGNTITVTATTVAASAATFVAGELDQEAVAEAGLDVSSQSTASAAITTLDDAIIKVSAERSKLGAYQNRLEHTINNLNTTTENLQASESRIRDVDIASEMMNYTKLNILQQAAQSMLAQANQAPQGVLQLLR